MLKPGDHIDIWVVEAALGTGGMGSVYRCHNRNAKRILAAVKVLDRGVRTSEGAQERFVREAEILYALDHPHIVKVRNVRIDGDPAYIEMEFVEGESLERRLRRGAIPFEEALRLMRQLADAVAYLHSQGVCHRDLKPANVLIDKQGRVRIVDFGLALESSRSRLTQAGMTFGTVSYAPPEWITPEELLPENWDLYALGVMFWEMLTGRVAFAVSGQGSVRQQAMQVILSKQDHPPLDPGPRFHDDVRQLVRDMTHAQVEERVQTLAEVHTRVNLLSIDMVTQTPQTLTPAMHVREQSPNTWPAEDDDSDLGVVPRPRPMPVRATDQAPRGQVVMVLGLAALAGLLAVGLGVMVALQLTPVEPPAPLPRAVSLDVRSGDDLPSQLSFRDAPLSVSAEGRASLGDLMPGDLSVDWVRGEDCPPADCPGDACPAHCGTGSSLVVVPEGEGPFLATLELPAAATASLELMLPELPEGVAARALVDGTAITPDADGHWRTEPLLAGEHAAVVLLGTCPDEPADCADACPEGCVRGEWSLSVPWRGEPEAFTVPLTPPEPPRVAAPAPAARSTRFVTHGAFARWLADHSEYQRDAAIAAGRGDGNYLSGWTGAEPPAGTAGLPLTNVSYAAAAAYCAGRGGLPAIDASLPRSAGAPPMEFRTDGTTPKVLEDGERRIPVSRTSDSNAITGFRCAR